MKTRMLALLLCLVLAICPVLAACGDDTPEESSTATTSKNENSTGESTDKDSLYTDDKGQYTAEKLLPEFNFSETEFRVCVYNNNVQDTYFSEEVAPDLYETTDSVLNDAVRTRNDLIEEKYGVKIVACAVDNVYEAVNQDVTTGTELYDAAMPFMSACTTLAQNGSLYDLTEFGDYIHLDAPWWDQNANKSLSIADKIYFTTGDISIMQKIVSTAILFNKNMYKEYCIDKYGDMYQLVRDHKWTIDAMYEMGKSVTIEDDGVDGMTYADQWGMAGTNSILSMYMGAGYALISKNNDDIPELAFGSEASIVYAEKVLGIFQDTSWFINTQKVEAPGKNVWVAAMGIFGEERALFYPAAFSAVKKLRNFDVSDKMGIIPQPLAQEGQDSYHTPNAAKYAYGICIPSGVPNPDFSAYMIELMAAGGKNTITPAYYDVTLKTRDAKDADSEEMLDKYIFANLSYDLGQLYDFGTISSMFDNLMSTGDTNVASKLDSIRDSINKSIDDYVDAYQMNG